MVDARRGEICPVCGGQLVDGTTDFSVKVDSETITIPDVPGQICTKCGEAIFTDQTAEWLEKDIESRRQNATAKRSAATGKTTPDIEPISRRRLMRDQDG